MGGGRGERGGVPSRHQHHLCRSESVDGRLSQSPLRVPAFPDLHMAMSYKATILEGITRIAHRCVYDWSSSPAHGSVGSRGISFVRCPFLLSWALSSRRVSAKGALAPRRRPWCWLLAPSAERQGRPPLDDATARPSVGFPGRRWLSLRSVTPPFRLPNCRPHRHRPASSVLWGNLYRCRDV